MHIRVLASTRTGASGRLGGIPNETRRYLTPLLLKKALYPTGQVAEHRRNEFERLALRCYQAGMSSQEVMAEMGKALYRVVLERCEWNQCKAAKALQVHRNTLHRKILEWRREA